MTALQNRYEFVLFFDVENGNPNGDPDAGNMPRIDPETGFGLVTDVCLKRKIRNFIELATPDIEKEEGKAYHIYVTEKAVLNRNHLQGYEALKLKPEPKKLPKKEEDARNLTRWMCNNFYDIRAFGAVMTTDVNCGQVRGPVQLSFARSVEPIMPQEISITRMAVTNEKDLEKERTMGRKYIVPYALYRVEGFISPHLASDETKGTGFSEKDLELLWQSLCQMFDHDRSAARGKMAARKLVVFRHASKLGNAPAHTLFDRITVNRSDATGPARSFSQYAIEINQENIPEGIQIEEKL
ncbi:type I-C CRISPR-associated protein Cas7/Csd2 [Desulfobotulus mexicanus]|uniref:Type I-C CRISPR-associated protein Cas7/Csd2 n=1 Tax=Desulfobotulus mexicanus TaxID=2586642 RepID=A0A5Q4VBN3_9BACT|nr:type I-C CRISPR-associated protein Cas7/Csd2 [Desulfobotulus mexicanus]TYT75109.1 type I-C CRISPR-associated protein Cas7/Csd2 [Desulfobotulus mexicanus]